MDAEKLETMFEEVDEIKDYNEFDKIPIKDRLSPSQDMCGLLKVFSLLKKQKDFSYSAQHDILYLADAKELKELTQADVLYLSRCGIHYDSDGECLASFT